MSDLPDGPFDVVYADPPWHYAGREQFGFQGDVGLSTGGAVKQYPTMPLADICLLDVSGCTARDALLFMWTTGPQFEDSFQVMRSWDFQFTTVAFVWEKERINPGYYTLSSTEFCLVAKRGRIPTPRGTRNERQFLSELRGEHSAKPAEIRARIERMFPTQKKLEMFARERCEGWTSWGNEI